ncbi:MAG: serine hydrolase domain-containing protein [Chryseolinea sp.]
MLLLIVVACNNNPGKTRSERIDQLLKEAFDDKEFIGSVLVADKGRIIYKKSFGYADQQKEIQNTDSTKFPIASISKPITAVLILRLAEKGVLKSDDTISKYFPKAPSGIGAISIHNLLTHTSGINEVINKEPNMDVTSLVEHATLRFPPGFDFEYSNSGYVLLKEIAEIATQREYAELVQTEVFNPASMTSSGIMRRSTPDDLVKGYQEATQAQIVHLDFPIENVDGAGSVYSTVEDLYKLDRALYTEQLLSKEMTQRMLNQHVSKEYSYGWFVRERGGIWDVYWAKGDLPGFTSFISRRVQKDQFIILLSNAQNAALSDLENDIAVILKTQE